VSGRPADWYVLDLDGDPTPGDLYTIDGMAARFLSLASDAGEAAGRLRSLAGDEAVVSWAGSSGDAYREEIGGLPRDLDKLSHSYGMAGGVWACAVVKPSPRDRNPESMWETRHQQADLPLP
jgi:hypothetical protein